MAKKVLTVVVLGTGEKLVTKNNLGIGHEFVMALTGAKVEGAPDIEDHEDGSLPIIRECASQFIRAVAIPIAAVTLGADNTYTTPSASTHLGIDFVEKDLQVVYGISPDIWDNIFNPTQIHQEILLKANALADSYFEKILTNQNEDEIVLFVFGFSRGGCIATQAMNILYDKLRAYDLEKQTNILAKVSVDIFLLDPVPGNILIDNDPVTHTIPTFVNKLNVIYSEYESRVGFQPLREFYKASDTTRVEIRTFPCDHATIKRRDYSDDANIAPADLATHLLAEHYSEVSESIINISVYIKGDSLKSAAPRRVYSDRDIPDVDFNEQHKKLYRELAIHTRKKCFGVLSPLFRKDRKIRGQEDLQNIYANWPTALKKLEDECKKNTDKSKFSPLVVQLELLLKHGHKSHCLKNADLIYQNFADCIAGLKSMVEHGVNSTEYRCGYKQLKIKLEYISQNAEHDATLLKIVMIALAVLATICTAGIAGILFYNDKSHNYFTLQPKTGYLANCVKSKLEQHEPEVTIIPVAESVQVISPDVPDLEVISQIGAWNKLGTTCNKLVPVSQIGAWNKLGTTCNANI